MKRFPYMLAFLLLLVIIPVSAQKPASWKQACRQRCEQAYKTCLQQAQGDGPKKKTCYWNYRGCLNWCANPPGKA